MIDTTTCGTANTVCLTYDAFNRMVERQVGANFTQILYSPIGKTAVMDGQTLVNAHIPLPGGATLYETSGQKNFWHKDWLGSARLSSTVAHTIIFDRAFAPFGETYNVFGQTSGVSSFTGDTQDTFIVNGGNPQPYDTPNRELHPIQGRWLSPDPAGMAAVDMTNPQSWNLYAYVSNNPVTHSDPLGLGPNNGWAWYGWCCAEEQAGGRKMFFRAEPTGGNDIFDALSGAPGTYLYRDIHGNVGFGFSQQLWVTTNNIIDSLQGTHDQPVLVHNTDIGTLSTQIDVSRIGWIVNIQNIGTETIASGIVPDYIQFAQNAESVFSAMNPDLRQAIQSALGN